MKRLLYVVPLFLSGCLVTEWLTENEEAVKAVGDTAESLGGPGALIGLGLTTAVGLAKWWEHKRNFKGLVKVTQQVKNDITPAQKAASVKAYKKYMPKKLKKLVAKVKPAIKVSLEKKKK